MQPNRETLHTKTQDLIPTRSNRFKYFYTSSQSEDLSFHAFPPVLPYRISRISTLWRFRLLTWQYEKLFTLQCTRNFQRQQHKTYRSHSCSYGSPNLNLWHWYIEVYYLQYVACKMKTNAASAVSATRPGRLQPNMFWIRSRWSQFPSRKLHERLLHKPCPKLIIKAT